MIIIFIIIIVFIFIFIFLILSLLYFKIVYKDPYINHNHLDNKKNIMNDVYEIYNYDK